jgi:hypothetical protein
MLIPEKNPPPQWKRRGDLIISSHWCFWLF